MRRISRRKLITAIVLMLSLLFVPAFVLVLEHKVPLERETKVSIHHSSFSFSTFLKGSEEKEKEEISSISRFAPLLDLSNHLLNLLEAHDGFLILFMSRFWIIQPRKLALSCTLLI